MTRHAEQIESIDTGGKCFVDIITLCDGKVIVFTDEYVKAYASRADYDNCQNDPKEYGTIYLNEAEVHSAEDGKFMLMLDARGGFWNGRNWDFRATAKAKRYAELVDAAATASRLIESDEYDCAEITVRGIDGTTHLTITKEKQEGA
jgi:hypothetical protein